MHISLIPQVLWKARIKDIANETRTTVFKVNKMIYPKQQNNNKKEGINQLQIWRKKRSTKMIAKSCVEQHFTKKGLTGKRICGEQKFAKKDP